MIPDHPIPVHEALDPETMAAIRAYAETPECPPLIALNIRQGTFRYDRKKGEFEVYLFGKSAAELRGISGSSSLLFPPRL